MDWPRLEPFSSGQVYNLSRTARIHVLPAPNTSGSIGIGSNTSMTSVLGPSQANQDKAAHTQHVSLPFY